MKKPKCNTARQQVDEVNYKILRIMLAVVVVNDGPCGILECVSSLCLVRVCGNIKIN